MGLQTSGQIGNKLRLAVALTVGILVAEAVGGYLANSLALLSDAGHVFTDILALVLSWVGVLQAQRPGTAAMTFGFHRVGVLIALINAASLALIAGFIVVEAYHRLQQPEAVDTRLMLGVALAGLAVNMVIILLLRRDQQHSINIHSAFLHVLGDALASIGVIVGGLIIMATNWFWADPLISLLVAGIIAVGSWGIIQEAVGVFLEATPPHVNLHELRQAMESDSDIVNVHDLHVWSISPDLHMLSCHVLSHDLTVAQTEEARARLDKMLAERFAIAHTTMQFECAECIANAPSCPLAFGNPDQTKAS
ncbi:MAG: cation transporter [Chloroflexota bacterium]|nr:MAG: cation transporter [Chloroflexota bacterium]